MPPLASDSVGAVAHNLVNHNSAAATCSKNYAKHNWRSTASAINRLGQRKTICVVGCANLHANQALQILPQRHAVEARAVGVAMQSCVRIFASRRGNAHAHDRARLTLRPLHQLRNRQQSACIIAFGGGHALAPHHVTIGPKHRGLNFCSTKINTYAVHAVLYVARRANTVLITSLINNAVNAPTPCESVSSAMPSQI